MARLAIKGHKTSGRFVIALLKMMGGKDNIIPCDGTGDFCYFIDNDGIIKHQTIWNKDKAEFKQYTYGEFVENFPYKIGDKVRYFVYVDAIESSKEETAVVIGMKWHKDTVIYTLDNNTKWTVKDMYPIEETTLPEKTKTPVLEGQDYSEGRCSYKIPEGFEFEKVENGDIILKPKKKELPKTYEECCEVLGINELPYMVYTWNRNEDVEVVLLEPQVTLLQQLEKLRRIITCRNAYWKLADDWSFKIGGNSQEVVYAITIWGTGILKDFYHALNCNRILVFPTEEMRDAFYENFKDLINECKVLL